MPRDILIDPQRTGSGNPNIQFSGSSGNTLRLEVLSDGSVQFTGVSGSIFKIADFPAAGGALNSLFLSGTTAVTGTILPGTTGLYDLGSIGNRWANVYANGLSGSLTRLSDGTSAFIAGTNISITTGSNGAVTIGTTGNISNSYTLSFTNSSLTSGALTVNHNLVSKYLNVSVFDNNDRLIIPDEITATSVGVMTIDLRSFGTLAGTWNVIVADNTMVTAVNASNFFATTTNGTLYTTGSVAFRGNQSTITKPTDKGSDLFFYVSGSIGSKGTSIAGTSMFGGDVHVSGSLTVGTGSITITSNDIQFGSSTARTERNGSNIRSYVPSSGYFEITGSAGYASISAGVANQPLLILSGTDTKGGAGYTNFLQATNTYPGAVSPNKFFRISNNGNLEVVRSDYGALITTFTDAGVQLYSSAAVNSNLAYTNCIVMNSGSGQTNMFNDGNTHIHQQTGGMWISTLDGTSNIFLQAVTNNGSNYGTVTIGSNPGTIKGGLHITKYVTPSNMSYAAFYNNSGAPGSVWVSSGTGPYAVYCDSGRVQATEFDATSDVRLKDVKGNISVDLATQFVQRVEPIRYEWKEKPEQGVKFGFRAQDVVKAGFANLVTLTDNDQIGEETDSDGFVSPAGASFVMNYDQVVPIHTAVLKSLLDRIDSLEKSVSELQKKANI